MSALTVEDISRLHECCCRILLVSVQGMEANKEQQLATLNAVCNVFQNEFIDTFEWNESTKQLCRHAFAALVVNLLQLNLIQGAHCCDRIDDVDDLIALLNRALLEN